MFTNEKTLKYAPELLQELPDIVEEFPGGDVLKGIVAVYDVSETESELYNDLEKEHLVVRL